MKNILLTIEYDGTNYSGWQYQPERPTVQGRLEEVLSILCKQKITIHGTSRTDAGVHALGQRATFKGSFGIPVEKIPLAANHLLAGDRRFSPGDIRIVEAKEADSEFHPRFNALGKKYIYKIYNEREPDIFLRNYCYHVEKPLDIESMRAGAANFMGDRDFRSFMSAGGNEPESTVRTIYSAKWYQRPIKGCNNFLEFEIIGNGFLYNMVRIIVGTLVDIGLGKIATGAMPEIITSVNRQKAGHTAPPQGLYLAEVYFDKEKLYENQKNV